MEAEITAYLKFFWSEFSHICTGYGDLQNKSPHSLQMRKNTDQKTQNTDSFFYSKLQLRYCINVRMFWTINGCCKNFKKIPRIILVEVFSSTKQILSGTCFRRRFSKFRKQPLFVFSLEHADKTFMTWS